MITPAEWAEQNAAPVAAALLGWYARTSRDLPWRRSADPYAVWVSEIMLQQTQVERVKEFFSRFLDRFPGVAALAAADEQEVLRLWEGLGYYRRARQLHAAAKRVVAEHRGELPRTATELARLPGIGRYTAGAVASIALDLPEPIVEANSRRMLARLVGYDKRLDVAGGDEPLWEVAARLVPHVGAGRFNQALMDLGALVCTPDRPACDRCPVADRCTARLTGRVDSIPRKAVRRSTVARRELAVVVRRGVRVLLVQRGPGEWWDGLWDFPRLTGSSRRFAAAAQSSPLLAPLHVDEARKLGSFTHAVTHHRITLDVVACTAARAGRAARGRAWITPAALATLAMTSPGRRIARLLAAAAIPSGRKTPRAAKKTVAGGTRGTRYQVRVK